MTEPARFRERYGLWIYISGPLTAGDQLANIRAAVAAGDRMRRLGMIPVIPHLFSFAHYLAPASYDEWLALDLKYLEKCDLVLRLPGESSGADREVTRARELGLRVFDVESDVYAWQRGQIQ